MSDMIRVDRVDREMTEEQAEAYLEAWELRESKGYATRHEDGEDTIFKLTTDGRDFLLSPEGMDFRRHYDGLIGKRLVGNAAGLIERPITVAELGEYMEHLVSKGYASKREENGETFYKLTPEGHAFLGSPEGAQFMLAYGRRIGLHV
jgi:predicted transcriptional regulator